MRRAWRRESLSRCGLRAVALRRPRRGVRRVRIAGNGSGPPGKTNPSVPTSSSSSPTTSGPTPSGPTGTRTCSTPTLDALARRGFNFRGAHIMGSHHGAVCAPSRAMLMSGRTLFRVYDDLDAVETLPEVLGRSGYVTFGTGKWHQSRESFARSFSRGRNVFFGGMSDHGAVPAAGPAPRRRLLRGRTAGFSTDLFVDAAIGFLEDHAAADAADPVPGLRRLHRAPRPANAARGVPTRCTRAPDDRCRRATCRCTPSTTGG